jgi:hypothetical protein
LAVGFFDFYVLDITIRGIGKASAFFFIPRVFTDPSVASTFKFTVCELLISSTEIKKLGVSTRRAFKLTQKKPVGTEQRSQMCSGNSACF